MTPDEQHSVMEWACDEVRRCFPVLDDDSLKALTERP
jgi:hypothetical protein